MAIKVVIFDIGEVVLRGFFDIEEILSKKLGLPADEIDEALRRDAHLENLFRGIITEDAYVAAILQETKWNISQDELKKAFRKNFSEIPDARTIVQALKQKYTVVALSVHAREWIEYCRKEFALDALFSDGAFFSFDDGAMKPERAAFEKVLTETQAHPEEVLFIDDSEVNVRAARDLGMHAIQFESAAQLREELTRLKI